MRLCRGLSHFRCIVSPGAVRLGHQGAWAARKECFQTHLHLAQGKKGQHTHCCLKCDCCKGWVEKQSFGKALVLAFKPFPVLFLAIAAGLVGRAGAAGWLERCNTPLSQGASSLVGQAGGQTA